MTMTRKFWLLVMCLFSAPSAASSFDDYCPRSELRFEKVLAPFGMEATIETATLILSNPDSNKDEKRAALPMLGCSQNDIYAKYLIAALGDQDSDIRYEAIGAMRYLHSEKTFPSLIALVTDKAENESIRRFSSGVLSQIGGDNVDVALAIAVAARDTGQRPHTRYNHVFSLGRLTVPQSEAELHTLLDDGDANVAASAAVALGQHKVRASVPYLVQAVLSPSTEYWMKMKAIRELERLAQRDFKFTNLGNTYVKELYEAAQAEVFEWYESNKHQYEQ